MATNIFDPSGNLNYQPNIWQQQDWQTAGTVPMTGGPSTPGQTGDWWSQNAPPQQQQSASGGDWIGQALSEAQSTDDPGYWRQQISADPAVARGDKGAIDYWKMRIARGDGALAVRQGQLAPYGAGQSGGPGGGSSGQMGTFQADPGYQFRLGEGLNALQRGAAARGTLLTGGTQKALERYAQDYASGEFGNVFNRNLSLANLALPATNAIVNAAGQYGQQASNAITGQGNAAAAGTIGAGNAWMGTLGQLGQLGAGYAANYPYGRQPGAPSPYPPNPNQQGWWAAGNQGPVI